jgi:hypothetical protein
MATRGTDIGFIEPEDPKDQLRYLMTELRSVEQELAEYRQAFRAVSHVAPDRPREGMLRFADGSDWNPGAGRGYYQYVSGVWSKL